LDAETYADLRNQLLDSEAESIENEEIMDEEEAVEEEKSMLEAFQEGVQEMWNGVLDWFSNLMQ
jgi:hypothetical protein